MKSRASLLLQSHPYFCGLTGKQLAAVSSRVTVRRYRQGAFVRLRGEPCEGLYLIAAGTVRLLRTSRRGKEQELHRLAAGQSFGGVSALDGGPMMASAQAAQDTVILLLPGREFAQLAEQIPGVAVAVLRAWAQRLRELSDLASDLALKPVLSRVAGMLLRLSRNKARIRLPAQHELASMTGTVREVATRALLELERRGVVRRLPGRRVVILERKELLRLRDLG